MAERRDGLSNNPPRPQAEIASTVVEQVVAALLQPEAGLSDQERLTLLMGRMDLVAGSFFRQAAGSLYERALYEMRAEEGGLSILGLNQLFLEHIGAYLGRAVVFDDGAEMSWALWPHLLSGFSNLAYVLAAPVAGELRRRVTADPSYIEKIVTLMAAGSGRSLKELLLTEYNIDLSSADFWRRAIEEWDETIEELSELMDRLGYLRR
jgi:oligoendopeptidase F